MSGGIPSGPGAISNIERNIRNDTTAAIDSFLSHDAKGQQEALQKLQKDSVFLEEHPDIRSKVREDFFNNYVKNGTFPQIFIDPDSGEDHGIIVATAPWPNDPTSVMEVAVKSSTKGAFVKQEPFNLPIEMW